MAKKYIYNEFQKGVGNVAPQMYATNAVDLTEAPFLMLSKKKQESENSSTLSDIEIVNWFEEHAGNLYALCTNGKLIKLSGSTWGASEDFGDTDSDKGLKEFNGKFFAGMDTNISYSSDGGSTWDNDWGTTVAGLTFSTATHRPMEEVRGKLIIGNGQIIQTWDGIIGVDAALTLPDGFEAISIVRTPYYASILATRGNESRVFLWDTISDQYNYTLTVPDIAQSQIAVQSDLYVVNNKGFIFIHNGDSMTPIGRLPDVSDDNESGGLSLAIKPQGMALEGDEILIAVSPNAHESRLTPGTWAFNIKTGAVHHKYLLSSKEYHENGSLLVGAIYNKQGDIYGSFRKQGAGDYIIDRTNTGVSVVPNDKGSFVVFPMNNDGRKKRISKLILDYFRFQSETSSDTITISISDTTDYITDFGTNSYTADATAFTAILSDVTIGDMVTIATGDRAGDVSFITADNGANNYTVSPSFSGALASGDFVTHFKFKKIGVIDGSTDANTISKMMRIPNNLKDDYFIRLDFTINTSNNKNIKVRSFASVYDELAN